MVARSVADRPLTVQRGRFRPRRRGRPRDPRRRADMSGGATPAAVRRRSRRCCVSQGRSGCAQTAEPCTASRARPLVGGCGSGPRWRRMFSMAWPPRDGRDDLELPGVAVRAMRHVAVRPTGTAGRSPPRRSLAIFSPTPPARASQLRLRQPLRPFRRPGDFSSQPAPRPHPGSRCPPRPGRRRRAAARYGFRPAGATPRVLRRNCGPAPVPGTSA